MKRMLLPLVTAAAISVVGVSAQAQFPVQVTNFMFSGGDPVFPITNDVTFQNLLLTENFADSTSTTLALFDPADPTHTATDMLDTGVLNLETDPLPGLSSPTHGSLTSFVLTGNYDLTNLDIATQFGGPTTNVDVNQAFTASLFPFQSPTAETLINAIDARSGAAYGAGTLALLSTTTGSVVPEPSAAAVGAVCLAGLAGTFVRNARRRRAR